MTRRCVICGRSLPERSRSDRRTCSARCRVALSRQLRAAQEKGADGIVRHVIESVNANTFNAGWLDYILGLPRPDADPIRADGWDTGRETPSLESVRYVFEAQQRLDAPQYTVSVDAQEKGETGS